MNITERINAIEKELAEVKVELQGKGKWMPKEGEIIYMVDAAGCISGRGFWKNDNYTRLALARGRAYGTKEEAEFFSEQELVRAELWALADDEESDNKCHYSMEFDTDNKDFDIEYHTCFRLDVPYFKSAESCRNAIDTVGEDRIKKYIYGVK